MYQSPNYKKETTYRRQMDSTILKQLECLAECLQVKRTYTRLRFRQVWCIFKQLVELHSHASHDVPLPHHIAQVVCLPDRSRKCSLAKEFMVGK